MHARRLHWTGQGQRDALLAGLRAELSAWLGAWSVVPEALQLDAAAQEAEQEPATMRWLLAEASRGRAWIGASEQNWSRLGGLLLEVNSPDGLQLSERIATRAARALLSFFSGGGGGTTTASFTAKALDAWQADPRSGACQFRLHGHGFDAVVVVDVGVTSHFMPARKQTTGGLLSRTSAVVDETARFEVVLDLGATTLEDARALRIGDVLVSDASLGAAFTLRRLDHVPLLDGRLVDAGGFRAFLLEQTNTRTPTP